jgi:hypothetical protein
MPYFNQLYVEKHTGMLMQARIFELRNINTIAAKIETVVLAYSITSSGSRAVSIIDKIAAVTGLRPDAIVVPTFRWPKNTNPISLL